MSAPPAITMLFIAAYAYFTRAEGQFDAQVVKRLDSKLIFAWHGVTGTIHIQDFLESSHHAN